MRKRRGFFVEDALIGLAVITVLATLLAVMINRQNRVARKLAEIRSAVRLAERTMADMRAAAPAKPDPAVRIRRLAVAMPDSAAPADGMTWVEVTAQFESERAVLIGAVPAKAVP